MVYTPGLYTVASRAAADERQRFAEALRLNDEQAARERAGLRRQQSAAMDRNMAGLIMPGQAPNFAPSVTPPTAEQFPNRPGLAPLTPPAALPEAPKPGLSAFPSQGMSPGNVATGTAGPNAPKARMSQGEFIELPQAERQRILDDYNKGRGDIVSMGPFVGQTQGKKLSMSEFILTLPTREQVIASQGGPDQSGKGDFALGATGASAAPGGTQPIPAPTSVGINTAGARTAPLPAAAGTEEAMAAPSSKLQSHLNRATKIPSVVGSKQGQDLIRRATELGVDPAAAIALSGIETDFGTNVKTSVQGAQGILQVMPGTAKSMKEWFTNPANIEQYNIPDALVTAAQNMQPGSMDAGLLRLKYNELVGVPKNLWGAAYQSSAEDVRDAGSPLAISDGNGFSNADYNTAYIALYNEARNYVGVSPTISASPATNATFNLERLDRDQQTYQTTYDTSLGALKTEYDQLASQRQRLSQQLQFAQQSGFYNRLPELQRQLDAIDTMITGVNNKANELNTTYRTGIEDFNFKRINEFANIAVFTMRNGDAGPLSQMWSRATGQDIQLQPNAEDGTYNVYINGELDRTGVAPAQVESEFKLMFDSAYAAEQAKLQAAKNEALFKNDLEMAKITLQNLGSIEVATINQTEKNLPGWGTPQKMESDGVVTGYFAIGTGANRDKVLYMVPKPGVEIKDGVFTTDKVNLTIQPMPSGQAGLNTAQ